MNLAISKSKVRWVLLLWIGFGFICGQASYAVRPECTGYTEKVLVESEASVGSQSKLEEYPAKYFEIFEAEVNHQVSLLTDSEIKEEVQKVIDGYNATQGYVIGLSAGQNVKTTVELIQQHLQAGERTSKLVNVIGNLKTISVVLPKILKMYWSSYEVHERELQILEYQYFFKKTAFLVELEKRFTHLP